MNPENGGIENGSVGGIDRDSADLRMVFLAGYQQWMCRFLSAETLQSLNSDGGQVKKALLSVVVGYATICVTIVKWLFLLAIRLTDGF